jgi:pimeloyl-ACP methyl ester carboxylesterase
MLELLDRERSHHFTKGPIRLHYASAGSGKPVVLLHGFPETHRSWDLQVPALVDASYRAVTPDLRGYGESDRPRSGYDLATLAADVVSLIDELGSGPVNLVGHDWGGAIAWHLATHHAEKLERVVILDCPHPALMARALRKNRTQRRRSWYMFFFQLPLLPELWLKKNDGENLARMFRAGSPGEHAAPPSLIEAEKRALLAPGRLQPALAYYRTAFRAGLPELVRGPARARLRPIEVPVTLIWGEADSCLGLELIDGSERYAPLLNVHRVPNAGHFVHQERPDVVTPLLIDALEPIS